MDNIQTGARRSFQEDNLARIIVLLNSCWTVTRAEIEARNYDMKAVNPNAKNDADTRTPERLLNLIEAKGREAAEALAVLRKPPA